MKMTTFSQNLVPVRKRQALVHNESIIHSCTIPTHLISTQPHISHRSSPSSLPIPILNQQVWYSGVGQRRLTDDAGGDFDKH